MSTPDLRTLPDAELAQLGVDVAVEQERRRALATIPAQVADLTLAYIDGGGDRASLAAIVDAAQPPILTDSIEP